MGYAAEIAERIAENAPSVPRHPVDVAFERIKRERMQREGRIATGTLPSGGAVFTVAMKHAPAKGADAKLVGRTFDDVHGYSFTITRCDRQSVWARSGATGVGPERRFKRSAVVSCLKADRPIGRMPATQKPTRADELCPDTIPGGTIGFKQVSEELPRYKEAPDGSLKLIAKDWPYNATTVAKPDARPSVPEKSVTIAYDACGKIGVRVGPAPKERTPSHRDTIRAARGTWDPTIGELPNVGPK